MLYHGSGTGGLETLMPHISEHKKAMVHLAENIVLAAFYTVNVAGGPYYYFPYGFDDGVPVYNEYYPEGLADVYQGKRGYLYACKLNNDMLPATQIPGVFISARPVPVDSCMEIPDMYRYLLDFEKEGHLKIRRFESLTTGEKEQVKQMMRAEVQHHGLHGIPDHPYSRFIAARFPEAWQKK